MGEGQNIQIIRTCSLGTFYGGGGATYRDIFIGGQSRGGCRVDEKGGRTK